MSALPQGRTTSDYRRATGYRRHLYRHRPARRRHHDGQSDTDTRETFKGMVSIAIVNKPYTSDELKAAIRMVGIHC
jgi:hypothetical protein